MVSATLVSVCVLVGCGNSGQHVVVDATPAAMRAAAQSTLAKGTSKVDFSVNMTLHDQPVSMTGTGALDPANKRFKMSFNAKDLFARIIGSQSVPPDVQASFDKPFEVLIDHSIIYMHFPALASLGGGGKEWLKFDIAATNSDLGGLLGGNAGGPFGSDPSSFLQFLEGAGKVTKVGTEDVTGVSTTHFSGSYTLKDALAQLPDDQRAKVEHAFTGLGLPVDAETQEIPFDAWIDNDGLVRRLATNIDISKVAPQATTSGFGSLSETIDFRDFGAEVDIAPPSDDRVQDFSALTNNASTKFSSVASSIN